MGFVILRVAFTQCGQADVLRLKVLANRSTFEGGTDHIVVFYRKKGHPVNRATFKCTTVGQDFQP